MAQNEIKSKQIDRENKKFLCVAVPLKIEVTYRNWVEMLFGMTIFLYIMLQLFEKNKLVSISLRIL